MKHLIGLFVLILAGSCPQKTEVSLSITYKAATRGANFECVINQRHLETRSVGLDKKVGERILTPQEWKDITETINQIWLQDIPDLRPPSNNSTLDRDLIASLKIVKDNQIYESPSFDAGNPPIELQPLINKIQALAETVE